MKNILIYMHVEENTEYDIFHKTDAEGLNKYVKSKGTAPNFGNRLWFQGIISEISNPCNNLYYYNSNMSKDYINESFDLIIAPMANVFCVYFKDLLNHLAEAFKDIKIPVYVIACGVQADSYDNIDDLLASIKEPATRFISSVYDTGGEFALRGYFTKEFFDKLGFTKAVVTGCPSLYQIGPIKIEKPDILNLKPILNGNINKYVKFFEEYPKAVFFDQNIFWEQLYDKSFQLQYSKIEYVKRLIQCYGMDIVKALCNSQIILYPNMNDWREYIINSKFNFSYGSRIHGTIMPILAGIPSVIEICDSRTREMAEFFDIPLLTAETSSDFSTLESIYEWADFSKFNNTFKDKYLQFEEFLKQCGICDQINTNNLFFERSEVEMQDMPNKEYLNELSDIMNKNQKSLARYNKQLALRRKLTRKFHV